MCTQPCMRYVENTPTEKARANVYAQAEGVLLWHLAQKCVPTLNGGTSVYFEPESSFQPVSFGMYITGLQPFAAWFFMSHHGWVLHLPQLHHQYTLFCSQYTLYGFKPVGCGTLS